MGTHLSTHTDFCLQHTIGPAITTIGEYGAPTHQKVAYDPFDAPCAIGTAWYAVLAQNCTPHHGFASPEYGLFWGPGWHPKRPPEVCRARHTAPKHAHTPYTTYPWILSALIPSFRGMRGQYGSYLSQSVFVRHFCLL